MKQEKLEKFLKHSGISIEDIFDKLSLGVGVFDRLKCKPVYLNSYFHSIVTSDKNIILDKICSHVDRKGEIASGGIGTPGVIDIEKEFSVRYGFSVYSADENIAVVFLNEITSKSIATKSQMDNFLYDKMAELIAEISHEIGNPLAGVSTMLELLISRIDSYSDEKIKNYLERTFSEINRLTNILRRIRRVYVDNRIEIVEVDLTGFIDEVYQMYADQFKKQQVVFINDIGKDCFVLVDREAFYQVIKNFFDNSLAILRKKQWVRLTAENVDQTYVRLIYRNNGELIPEESFEKIFMPLYSTKSDGSGLGLFISLKLMTRMGGTINIVKPDEKHGVKFVIFIRRRQLGIEK